LRNCICEFPMIFLLLLVLFCLWKVSVKNYHYGFCAWQWYFYYYGSCFVCERWVWRTITILFVLFCMIFYWLHKFTGKENFLHECSNLFSKKHWIFFMVEMDSTPSIKTEWVFQSFCYGGNRFNTINERFYKLITLNDFFRIQPR